MSDFFFFGQTDKGLQRQKNEDTILVDSNRGFGLVADGVGGAAAGEIASAMFADTAQEVFSTARSSEISHYQCIQKVFLNANQRIRTYAGQTAGRQGMGCTAELLAISPGRFVLGHIGDSRTYRLRNGTLKQLTCDHSLVQEQLDQGLITREEASRHSFKNVISRAVGITQEIAVDVLRGNIFSGDIFLLCSDGLTDMVNEETIASALMTDDSLSQKANRLILSANDQGGKDNISVVLAQVA